MDTNAPAGFFGWGTEPAPFYIGDTRGDNERELVGELGVVVNGRRYLRLGGDYAHLRPYAGAGDIIYSPRWGWLYSVELGERFDAATTDWTESPWLPFALASAGLAAFTAPAIAAGAAAGASEGAALTAASVAESSAAAAAGAAPAWTLPSLPAGASTVGSLLSAGRAVLSALTSSGDGSPVVVGQGAGERLGAGVPLVAWIAAGALVLWLIVR